VRLPPPTGTEVPVNDEVRRLWVENDGGLYDLQRRSRLSLTKWVRANRTLIDEVAKNVQDGTKRQSYLKYGG